VHPALKRRANLRCPSGTFPQEVLRIGGLRFDDELAFHAAMVPAAVDAAADGIGSGGLCRELDSLRLSFFDAQAFLRRGESQAGLAPVGAVGELGELHAVDVVGGGDLELHVRTCFDTDGRRIELVLLGGDLDHLEVFAGRGDCGSGWCGRGWRGSESCGRRARRTGDAAGGEDEGEDENEGREKRDECKS